MENHHFQWVNPLFRLGHVQVRRLSTYQRALSIFSWTSEISNVQMEWRLWSQCVKSIAWLVWLKCGCFFLNETFQSFVDLTTWMFFVNCQAYVVSFYFGVELYTLDPGRIFPCLSLVSPQASMIKDMHSFLMTSADVFSGQMTAERPRVFMFATFCNYVEPRWSKREEKPEETWGNMKKQWFKSNLGWVKESDKHISRIVASSYAWDTLELPEREATNTWPKSPPRTCRFQRLRLVMTHVYPLLVAQLQA